MTVTFAIALILGGLIIVRLLRNRWRLSGIPGPWLASYTRLWKVHDVWQGQHHQTTLELHRRHGPLVRIGPKHISVADPKAIPIIYNVDKSFTKTAFYPIQSTSWKKKPQMNLFSTRDERFHRDQKRPIASAFSMKAMLEIEPAVDSCTEIFLAQINKFVNAQQPMDLGIWLQYYAFDVVGEMCFAQKLGFLQEGRDVDGIIRAIRGIIQYAAVCGQIPEAHHALLGNPLFPLLLPQMELWNQALVFTLKAINNRGSLQRDGEIAQTDVQDGGTDMMSRWMAIHEADPTKLSTRDMIVHLSTNVVAGSDTTAIALRAILYYLIRHPDAMAKTQAEIDRADQAGQLSDLIQYHESIRHLPYLGAVMKEAMRLHPSVGLTLERRVPDQGVTLAGKFIPGGTTVGINPWVVQRDPVAFPEPDAFIPERWLDSTPEKLREMEKAFFNFGGGSRPCIGKHISLMEMQKIIPQLLRSFDVHLHEGRPWKVHNAWFTQQDDFICDLVPRQRQM